ncbi:phosphotransferase system, enzyme I, PtsI [Austwickia chelonae]|uniref:Phosphoenolpyruvate-protein phosphotransferase n=1 Tax=Austwickia chelonae NBRC 105200 TaxID=1184607 RepID=K6VJM3_9MICO|nr:phosphoenolpyruvate--protein phosphotransferase [Austwickia chelonae]GAB76934.1 phosphoenolpyruvate--protein phosphotransferase [Austwickia chelonae NBRC 105200]SEW32517.1 phosphotransferase system, enzyme I, PtsI [Austwickia chelonae]
MSERTLNGIGVSEGIAVGPVVRLAEMPRPPFDEPKSANQKESARRIRTALEEVAVALEKQAATADPSAKEILEAGVMIARDPGLAAAVDERLATGAGAAQALTDAVDGYCDMLTQLGGYMAERVTDLRDVGARATCRLLGVPEPTIPTVKTPSVLVARDLAPSQTAGLNPKKIVGFITSEGGRTGHTAILAAQLGIPAVVGAPEALNLPEGKKVLLDGSTGTVLLRPTESQITAARKQESTRAALCAEASGPGSTKDGARVQLLVNIGTPQDARAAAGTDVEGVGLFRTEFAYLDRAQAPTREEQTRMYTEVFEAFAGKKVVVRTLDAGADKPLPFVPAVTEENPALGVRGLRLQRSVDSLLVVQLSAIADAARQSSADVWVMAPMVATRADAEIFTAAVRAVGLRTAGTMVEVPAAALRSRELLQICDFASIGTNDLSQYTFAADRMNGALSGYLDPWQPALLDLVAITCEGACEAGPGEVGRIRPVGVCGEAAGDPLLACVLVGLGVNSLSMAPSRVPRVRAALRAHDMATCRAMAAAARRTSSAEAAREIVRLLAEPSVRDL